MNTTKNKIAVGTVQFGMKYGINNKTGQISVDEVKKILNYALSNNITFLDTSPLYGQSEEVIGKCLSEISGKFNIVSKLPDCKNSELNNIFFNSLEMLKIEKIYGYLFHHYTGFINQVSNYYELLKLKEKGLIEKIGFSLYYTSELEYLFENGYQFDIVQFPYNVFDQRFSKYFSILKNKNIDIFARSIFLQGLVFKKPAELPNSLSKFSDKLDLLQQISENTETTITNLCLSFVIENNSVDKVVLGVDNIEQLKELVSIKSIKITDVLRKELNELNETDEKLILPINW